MDSNDNPPRDPFARGFYIADEDIPLRDPPNDPDAWELDGWTDEQRRQSTRDFMWQFNRGWVQLCTTDPRISEEVKLELATDPKVREWVWEELAQQKKYGEECRWVPRSVASDLAMRMLPQFDLWYAEQEALGGPGSPAGAGGPNGGAAGPAPPPNGPQAGPEAASQASQAAPDDISIDDWWLSRSLPPPRPLLGDLLTAGGRAIIGGPTGVGKSNLAYGMGGALATGRDFLHWRGPGEPVSVLVLDGEMSRDLVQERLRGLHRRLGDPAAGMPFHLASWDDFPNFAPLNTPEGRDFVLWKVDQIRPAVLILDNRMCLVTGNGREEESWAAVMPLVLELTKRGVCQLWLDHTGIATDRIYGSKVKEWQQDVVGLLTDATAAEKQRAGTDVHFHLQFSKARRRKPENRADFQPVTISLARDQWTWKADGAASKGAAGKVRPSRAVFLDALRDVAGPNGGTVEGIWLTECIRVGLIQPAEDGETRGQRRARLADFVRAKSELVAAKLIVVDGLNVFCPDAVEH